MDVRLFSEHHWNFRTGEHAEEIHSCKFMYPTTQVTLLSNLVERVFEDKSLTFALHTCIQFCSMSRILGPDALALSQEAHSSECGMMTVNSSKCFNKRENLTFSIYTLLKLRLA